MSQKHQEILQDILSNYKLNEDSILCRFTSEKYLKKANGQETLIVNNEPQEMVIDTYEGHGHVFMAKDIGPGLSFLTEPLDEYKHDDRICVSVRIKDLLSQGGLMYKVTSLPAYVTAFFFSLPNGEVEVER